MRSTKIDERWSRRDERSPRGASDRPPGSTRAPADAPGRRARNVGRSPQRRRLRLFHQLRRELLERDRPELPLLARTNSHRSRLRFLPSDDAEVRITREAGVPDLRPQLVRRVVEIDPQPPGLERLQDPRGVLGDLVADGEDDRLLRRDPDREVSPDVLEVNAEEALDRSEDRAMEHH